MTGRSGGLARLIEALLVVAAIVVSVAPLTTGLPYLSLIDPVHGVAGAARASELLEGRIVVPDVPGAAEVIWDSHGIPHIYATTDEAGFYALGWVEASLRLFQMDVYRRIVEGRLAELLGPKAVASDEAVIRLGLPQAVREQAAASLSDRSLSDMNRLVEYFILGINDYIDHIVSNDLLPLEYRLLGRAPEKWNYTDVYAISKLPALLYSFSESDLLVESLVKKWGPRVLVDLGIVEPEGPYTAYCNESRRWSPGPTPLEPYGDPRGAPNVGAALQELDGLKEVLAALGGAPASLALVVVPAFTASKAPLLIDDIHGSLVVPPMWLVVHMLTPSFHVAGLVLPGTPFVFAGRNLHVAWGFTSSHADQVDFYYFKWDSSGRYYFNGTWFKPVEEDVRIKVWDPVKHRMYTHTVTIRKTVLGPLIGFDNESYALAWTGLHRSNELAFLWRLNTARSYVDALRAQLTAGTPLLNLFVVDTGGHVAWSPVGLLPLRERLPVVEIGSRTLVNRGFLPFNASAGEGLWAGFISKMYERVVVDPRRPYLLNANNPLFSGNCSTPVGLIWYGYYYDSSYRADRALYLADRAIAKPAGMSVDDAEALLSDNVDWGLLNLTRILVQLAPRLPGRLGPEEANAISMLLHWNGTTGIGAGTGAQALALIWGELFVSKLWSLLTGVNATGWPQGPVLCYELRLLNAYMKGEDWALRYLQRGYPEELAVATLEEALKILKNFYGNPDPSSWDYGALHYYEPVHTLSYVLPGLSLPRKPAPGGPYSVLLGVPRNVSSSSGAPVMVASTGRIICDLSTTLLYISMPGGESGNPFSGHYADLYAIWARGGYVVVNLTAGPEALAAEARLYVNAWGESG